MSVRRAVFGTRPDHLSGMFISRPSVDALTASDDDLILSITQFTEQLILLGSTSSIPPGGTIVPFGYANAPFVLLTATGLTIDIATGGGADVSTFTTVSGMFIRPYPPMGSPAKSVQGYVTSASMLITCPGQQTSVASYAVFRKRLQ